MTYHIDRKDLDQFAQSVITKSFPSYNGGKFRVELATKITFDGAYWDGGSKSEYRIIQVNPLQSIAIPDAPFLQHSVLHENDHDLPPGYVVVKHSYFCGKDSGLTFYINPEHQNHFLPANNNTLTRDHKIVLLATRSLKSSYAGISDYRYHEAHQVTSIDQSEWDQAKTELITNGMLNRAGAITTTGKNAIDGLWSLRDLSSE